ncbi:MAG TPA: error-prone DNA polymerase [Solirubrobacteraceae bacterium]|nr:error-prone DNA polymerase [Solirubrobacteraceae bacterium]
MPGTPPYVELHCHSAYSFLDGASLPEELVHRAVALGYGALGLTDHDSLAGAMEFAMSARDTALRPIFGAEVTVTIGSVSAATVYRTGDEGAYRHLTLLVRDAAGWRNLCRLLTLAHAHTRDSPDRHAGQPSVPIERVLEHAQGLVCLSGCATHGVRDEATLRRLRDAFGPEGLRIELQRPYARGDRARIRELVRLAGGLGVRTVATGDVHAHTRMRALLQDAFVAVREGLTLDGSEVQRRPNHSHVLTRPDAMAARFAGLGEAVAETVRLAETLTFSLIGDLGYRYPGSEDHEAARALRESCRAVFDERYPQGHPCRSEAAGRLEEELRIIDRLGLCGFFLLHHEVLELAREVAVEVRGPDTARALLPPGRGRGSSVSSIVCYLTGLSHVDPIENGLVIGRFLHDDIVGMPDIDIDFPRDIRARLIARIPERYGHDRAALVAAFPTYRSRGAIRELGKALGLPAGEIERVARSADGWGGHGGVSEDIRAALGPRRSEHGRWAWLARLAHEAYGLPRHLSQHPGGMVISTRPLIDCAPIVPAQMAERQMVQWDKDSCADAGFLKIDLLGLGMLSAVERCVDTIARTRDERIDLSRIPLDDPETFAMIGQADTTGVFQIESRAQMGSLLRTRPATLEDLTVQVALVRPGPIVGGAVNPYIERRQALLGDPDYQVPYLHPSLQGPLAQTLGTIIFQDQVIEVSRAFAGFTAGEAEGLRRAMSRKRSQEAMDAHYQQFIEGARRTHPDASEDVIERVWQMTVGFAGFGFPKAHGVAFGLLAYQSTWLRVHYAQEFLCALLNEQPMGFYPPDSLIHEAQRRGITILPPDVNRSDAECSLTAEGAIRIGLAYIKDVHEQDIARLLAAREESGTFTDLGNLAARAGVSTPTLERLAWSGACDPLAGGGAHARRTALWQLGVATPAHTSATGRQLALHLPLPDAPSLPGLGDWEAMLADYAATGVSVKRHPLSLLRDRLTQLGALRIDQLSDTQHGAQIAVGGLVIARQRPQTANGITFLLLEDETGTLNVIVQPKLYEQRRLVVRTEPLILITGRLERHARGGGAINLLAHKIETLTYTTNPNSEIKQLPTETQTTDEDHAIQAATGTDDFRAVAPPAMNFGQGRRR